MPRRYRPPSDDLAQTPDWESSSEPGFGGVAVEAPAAEAAVALAVDRATRARALLEVPPPRADLGRLLEIVSGSALPADARVALLARLRADDALARAIDDALARAPSMSRESWSDGLARVATHLAGEAPTAADPETLLADAARAVGLPAEVAAAVPSFAIGLATLILDEEDEEEDFDPLGDLG